MTFARFPLLVLAWLLLAGAPLAADELILNSGKVIHGQILSEEGDSYTVRMRANMNLNIAKGEVSRVVRDAPPAERRPRAAPVKPAPLPKPAAPPKPVPPVAPSAVPPTAKPAGSAAAGAEEPPPPPAEATTGTDEENGLPVTLSQELPPAHRKVGVVSLNEAKQTAFYDVPGLSYVGAMRTITDPRKGSGFLVRGTRRPSRTHWRLNWYGKPAAGGTSWETFVVNSTITTTMPAWKYRRKPSPADRTKWDAMIREADDIEKAHRRLIDESLDEFATEVTNLTAPNEEELRVQTGKILSEARARSDLRRKGYDRRRDEMKRRRPIHRRKKSR